MASDWMVAALPCLTFMLPNMEFNMEISGN